MRKLFLFFLLGFPVLFTCRAHAQLNKAFEIDELLVDTWSIHALNDDSIIVTDPKNNQQALQLRSIPDGAILNAHRIGRGPGEISSEGTKNINISGNRISVWDNGAKELLKYDRNLVYQTSLMAEVPAMSIALLGDSLAFTSPQLNAKEFLHLHKTDGRDMSSEPSRIYSTDSGEKLSKLSENFLLKQGPFLVSDGFLYIGYDFSSVIVKASPDSIVFVTGEPSNIPFPDYDAVSIDGNTRVQSAPDINNFPLATLDLKVDSNYIYVLNSGKKLDAGRLKKVWLAATGGLDKKMEDLKYSKTIFLYDKDSGKYIRTVTLPQKATRIAVSESYIFGLSLNEEGLPVIIAYDKTFNE